jgi:hypothetical protein
MWCVAWPPFTNQASSVYSLGDILDAVTKRKAGGPLGSETCTILCPSLNLDGLRCFVLCLALNQSCARHLISPVPGT